MKIIVEGIGELTATPDLVNVYLDFNTKNATYSRVVEEGTKRVANTLNHLQKLNFTANQFKTRSFRVDEEKIYNDKTRNYLAVGFIFTQMVTVSFDYTPEKLAEFINTLAEEPFAPNYRLQFNLKDDKKEQAEVLTLAYRNAEEQAKIIAASSGSTIKECKEISFQPFENRFVSNTQYESSNVYAKATMRSIQDNITETFNPEDIRIKKSIYCIFEAE